MVAACERPVAVVTERKLSRGSQLLLASGLNIISCRPEPQPWHSALRACTEALLSGRLVLVFGRPQDDGPSRLAANSALALAREAWSSAFPGQSLYALPVHRFYPSARDQDILIHIGDRVALEDPTEAQPIGPGSRPTLEAVCGTSVFALKDSLLAELFGDLQHVLQNRLREWWQARPGWSQNVDGFRLSSYALEFLRRLNQCEPETLVTLRQLCETHSETRRQRLLAGLRGELESKQAPILKRLLRWTESVLGMPLACYGLVNHLVPALVLYVCGLVKRGLDVNAETWLARALVILGCYVGQIALVDSVAGRAAAGYYALTLPVSGAYLFRCRWLLQQRAPGSLLGLRAVPPRRGGRVSGKKLFERLDQILAKAAAMPPAGSR